MSAETVAPLKTTEEIAGYLQVAESTIRRLAREGAFPPEVCKKVPWGQEYRFNHEKLDAWMEESTARANENK
jgi:excisionase family DNA binding protein